MTIYGLFRWEPRRRGKVTHAAEGSNYSMNMTFLKVLQKNLAIKHWESLGKDIGRIFRV